MNVMWQPGWEGDLGENGHVYVWLRPFVCSPEIITTLLADNREGVTRRFMDIKSPHALFVFPVLVKNFPRNDMDQVKEC